MWYTNPLTPHLTVLDGEKEALRRGARLQKRGLVVVRQPLRGLGCSSPSAGMFGQWEWSQNASQITRGLHTQAPFSAAQLSRLVSPSYDNSGLPIKSLPKGLLQ